MARLKKLKFNNTSYEFPVEDVKLNTTSVVTDGVASIPVDSTVTASSTNLITSGAVKSYVDDHSGSTYTAGKGIDITSDVISAKIGEGLDFGNSYKAMRGPCPEGYHIWSSDEFLAIKNAGITLGAWTTDKSTADNMAYLLKISNGGYLNYTTGTRVGARNLWTSTYSKNYIRISTTRGIECFNNLNTYGIPIRPYKDTPVVPDSSWIRLYNGSSVATNAGIFHNPDLGLISISADGTTWYTLADKSLGATKVWNQGDAYTQENTGRFYQWGNNYPFPYTGATTTSSTKVDASNYGPENYYYSSTFIINSTTGWDSSNNENLRGGTTGVISNSILNKGVLSVNGETGDLIIKEYHAGEGIEIGDNYSAIQGPAPDGFHVPSKDEWNSVKTVWIALGGGTTDGTNFGIALKLPFTGYRLNTTSNVVSQTGGYYWCATHSNTASYAINFYSSNISTNSTYSISNGMAVRGFKDSPVVPDGTWTKLYGTSIEAGGIFWSSTDGLISLSIDGTTWITIADKNLGATTVWNDGDTLSETNCGGYFQRGNNYMFPFTGSVTTSTTQVDASNYGPGNYYSSSTFIKYSGSWDSSNNANLWGGVTGMISNAITNTGVLSVNGKTGDVTVEYNAGPGINIGTYNDYSAMQGPCTNGFHIPSRNEWQEVLTMGQTINARADGTSSGGEELRTYLKLPCQSYRSVSGGALAGYTNYLVYMWCSSPLGNYGDALKIGGESTSTFIPKYSFTSSLQRGFGCPIRAFKNVPVKPDNTWTTIYDGSSTATNAGIFYNSTLGLISISSDGINWKTISDKNIGATAVRSSGSITNNQKGYFYQRGNNYGFPSTGSLSDTSATQVDASNYGPGNYYYSSTFITTNPRDSSNNGNLRGGVTGIVTKENAIINIGSFSDYVSRCETQGTASYYSSSNEVGNQTYITPGAGYLYAIDYAGTGSSGMYNIQLNGQPLFGSGVRDNVIGMSITVKKGDVFTYTNDTNCHGQLKFRLWV